MARHILTDRHVRHAKPRPRAYRLADGDGLYLFVPSTGARAWQYRYRWNGKQQTATLGKAADMTLAEARQAASKARRSAADGHHLTIVKKTQRAKRRAEADNTFTAVAKAWADATGKRMSWSPDYRREVDASIRNHLLEIHALPVTEIVAPIVAPILGKIEKSAPHMIEKVRRRLHAILDYCVEQGAIVGNPLPMTRKGATALKRHFPAVTKHADVGAMLLAADQTDVCRGVQRAHRLVTFTGQRISEVAGATWKEMDLERGTWTIPRRRMKKKNMERGDHEIPLPPVLLKSLKEWRLIDPQDAVYVCPAPRDSSRPITPEALEKFYRRTLDLAGKHSPHSWRTVLKTWSADAGKETEVVEAQLDHVVGTKVASAYDRAKRLELRRKLMKWYEDTLIAARDGAKVIRLTTKSSGY